MSNDQPKPTSSKDLPSLPPSNDQFWEDAEVTRVVPERLEPAQEHLLHWEGPYAVCSSCSYRHTVPLSFEKYDLINGRPVKKSKNPTAK